MSIRQPQTEIRKGRRIFFLPFRVCPQPKEEAEKALQPYSTAQLSSLDLIEKKERKKSKKEKKERKKDRKEERKEGREKRKKEGRKDERKKDGRMEGMKNLQQAAKKEGTEGKLSYGI